MDIDKMDAGREMDALVAERVMGFKVQIVERKRDWFGTYKVKHYRVGNSFLPNYSTDISAAWMVVEKIDVHFHLERYGYDTHEWVCTLDIGNIITGVASTAPLAICRAVLKAVDNG